MEGLAELADSRSMRLHYEQVVTDPAGCSERLAAFLGLDAPGETALREGLMQAVPSSIGRWRNQLSAAEERAVLDQCGPLLGQLGYL